MTEFALPKSIPNVALVWTSAHKSNAHALTGGVLRGRMSDDPVPRACVCGDSRSYSFYTYMYMYMYNMSMSMYMYMYMYETRRVVRV